MTQGIKLNIGDRCNDWRCCGRLITYSTHVKRDKGIRVAYLQCNLCGDKPANNRIETPLEFKPAKPKRQKRVQPQQIADVENLIHFDLMRPIRDVIYFLCFDGNVVYVGKARNLLKRIGEHQESGKVFDSVWYFHVDRDLIIAVESEWITKLQPTLNMIGTPRHKEASARGRELRKQERNEYDERMREVHLRLFAELEDAVSSGGVIEPTILELGLSRAFVGELCNHGLQTIASLVAAMDEKPHFGDSETLKEAIRRYYHRKFAKSSKAWQPLSDATPPAS